MRINMFTVLAVSCLGCFVSAAPTTQAAPTGKGPAGAAAPVTTPAPAPVALSPAAKPVAPAPKPASGLSGLLQNLMSGKRQ